jgi:transcriptional regulator with XRE-family HTH domain
MKIDRREVVRRLLARREREGLTYAELARRSGESAHALSWWAWRLRQEGGQDGKPKRARAAEFIEVKLSEEPEGEAASGLELVLASGHRLVIRRGFDEESLRRLVRVLSC